MTDPAPARSPIDLESLLQRCLGDPQFACTMLQMFAQQTPPMVRDLRASLAGGDATRAASVAHALKGSAATVSAQDVSEVAASIEDACRTGQIDAAVDAMGRLDETVGRCLARIDALARTGIAQHSRPTD